MEAQISANALVLSIFVNQIVMDKDIITFKSFLLKEHSVGFFWQEDRAELFIEDLRENWDFLVCKQSQLRVHCIVISHVTVLIRVDGGSAGLSGRGRRHVPRAIHDNRLD